MIVPSKTLCDLCGSEIKPGARTWKVDAPLTEAERKQILDDLDQAYAGGDLVGPFGIPLTPSLQMVGNRLELQVCDCLPALLPQLVEARSAQLGAFLKRRQETRERREATQLDAD